MADLFLYGTLRYVPLLECVLGRSAESLDARQAQLADHAVRQVRDQPFPAIEACEGASAPGLLLRGVTQQDLDALNFYEGGFDYALKQVEVRLEGGEPAHAEVYFPAPGMWDTTEHWDLDGWIADWGALSLRAAEEVMDLRGCKSAEEIARIFPSIRRRAASWLAAQARPEDPAHDLARDVRVHGHKRAYVNFFAMEEMDLQFRRYDGSFSPVVNRGVALVGRAAVVLPYDPVRDQVLLIEQFRAATYIAGEKRPWMWEPVAGLIDPGETPEETARREAQEEAGVAVTQLERVAEVYPSSGASGEFIHIFVGLADLDAVEGGGGLASEHEDIRSKVISFSEFIDAVDRNTYQDMPLVTAALWLARHRDRLRAHIG
ncbi:NUDIX domain-containing protein [Phaeobacter gallaeciensis]|uniref:NUDIX domain-containing protein n=1 Tax=Phaeobacter TaxID=302485 RepID=UPI0023804FD8|nr:NUDIX domain-containing protein [Phaeobacter gallaeciensis]MDE4274542.1 NUDIX domain-containing protein [Phaeobacter gallaeciensis]MDE4299884.1 NUDIX domain-containing protein [Phaeobacter gallaeciensis]MDE5185049.1 NUDIX domain-containing protein [Phaeobacter gallaeciensis]